MPDPALDLDTAAREALWRLRDVVAGIVMRGGTAIDTADVATLSTVCELLREALGIPEGGRIWPEGDPRACA